MKRKMRNIAVFMNENGNLAVVQDNGMDDDEEVEVHPDQVDVLIKWLCEVRDELLQGKK